jgi:hypothetical protein
LIDSLFAACYSVFKQDVLFITSTP